MNDIFKQVLVGVFIAAIAGVWAFASTRASVASVDEVETEIKQLERELEDDIDKIGNNIEDIKNSFHAYELQQTQFQTQVRQKLSIQD
jgi:prefoldin subunit 5